jgi:hypothetical protein
MTLSIYDASIPVFIRNLKNLDSFLTKAEAHASAHGVALATYAEKRLAEDMHPFARQIQIASDAAKGGAARLAGVEAPAMADTETTFPELHARIAKTIAFLETVKPEQMAGAEARTVELPLPGRTLSFSGQDFLLQFALPNFMFHLVAAYAILRHAGVPLGKMDFLAGGNPLPV